MTERVLDIVSYCLAAETTRSGENYLGLIPYRPRAVGRNRRDEWLLRAQL